jgi:hypothetical protein
VLHGVSKLVSINRLVHFITPPQFIRSSFSAKYQIQGLQKPAAKVMCLCVFTLSVGKKNERRN